MCGYKTNMDNNKGVGWAAWILTVAISSGVLALGGCSVPVAIAGGGFIGIIVLFLIELGVNDNWMFWGCMQTGNWILWAIAILFFLFGLFFWGFSAFNRRRRMGAAGVAPMMEGGKKMEGEACLESSSMSHSSTEKYEGDLVGDHMENEKVRRKTKNKVKSRSTRVSGSGKTPGRPLWE